jgi:uncharacterized protein
MATSALDAPCRPEYCLDVASVRPTREDIATAVRTALGATSEEAIVAVYLFGSYSRGSARVDSDIDLGLLYAAPPAATLLAQPFLIEAQLAEQLGRPVQCVVMNTAPVDLVHQILMERSLLLDANPSYRIRFEIVARNKFFDLKPMLDRYRRARRVA